MPRLTDALREQIRQDAGERCGYCQTQQEYMPWPLEIEHIMPRARGGLDERDNLWLACRSCNAYKRDQIHGRDPLTGQLTQLFNPRRQEWVRHFSWSTDGTRIQGKTACGRATVIALNLNNLIAVTVRRNWVNAGWHPPRT